ncbi:hypothetical protein L226DRAFT_541009 [Lentinus tigrinus ALCF2SS1-7]|uniref:uncharacterized protein n=1 Tax=Lentinus tigrinus ALCF2SS1-7 TaxID=1328758 RepID=UPI0011662976|nr:hypothetical protein L226DRAFT_541009 [Lentinus tigrinus ALCF2SS1-7]
MDSLASSPSVYSQSSYPASSSLRTPSPCEPLPPTRLHESPLTCLDIYHEWFSQDMTKHEPTARRRLLDILAEGRRRREPSPQSLPDTEDPLACVDIYRQWFAQDMAKDYPAHRRRLLNILTDDRKHGYYEHSSPPQSLPETNSDQTHPESSIHAPRPVLGWSPTSYWNDDALASWSRAAAVARTDDAPNRPSGDLWDRMRAHSWDMICMHPRPRGVQRKRVAERDSRMEEIRRKRRILLLEELLVRCESMTMDSMSSK